MMLLQQVFLPPANCQIMQLILPYLLRSVIYIHVYVVIVLFTLIYVRPCFSVGLIQSGLPEQLGRSLAFWPAVLFLVHVNHNFFFFFYLLEVANDNA